MGNAVLRREDPDLLTGRARFVADMAPAGTLHLAFVRSPMAHARIGSVESAEARDDVSAPQRVARRRRGAALSPIAPTISSH